MSALSNFKATRDIEDAEQATTDVDYEPDHFVEDEQSETDASGRLKPNDAFDDDEQSVVGNWGSTLAEHVAEKMALDEHLVSNLEVAIIVPSVSSLDMVPDDGEEFLIRNEVTQTGQPDNIIGKRICRS